MQQELNKSLTNLSNSSSDQRKHILTLFSELQSLSQNLMKVKLQLPLKNEPKKVTPKILKKKQVVVKEKDLFKRYISKTTFLNIMSFLPINGLLSFRLISRFSNYLVEFNVPFLIKYQEKKHKFINSLNQGDLYIPVTKSLYNVSKHLIRLKKSMLKKQSDFHPKLQTYINFLFELHNSYFPGQLKNPTQYEKLTTVIAGISSLNQFVDWYNLNEKHRRIIQKLRDLNIEQDKFENYQNYTELKAYLLKLLEFASQPQYYLICNVHKKPQVLQKLQKSINQLQRLNIKIIAKSNFLPKIEILDQLFFKNVCCFLEYQDLVRFRLVCKTFNNQFQSNITFYNHWIMRRINYLQSSYNMNQFQEQQVQNCEQKLSVHERLFVIVQDKIGKKPTIEKIISLSPKKITETILSIESIDVENIISERFGVNQEQTESVQQLVSEMLAYYKQQSIMNELPKLHKQQLALDKFESLNYKQK